MLQTLRERLVLILVALLPFHALLVTVGTKLIEGPGNAPLGWLALWKEAVLGGVMLVCIVEVLMNGKLRMENGKWWKVDVLDVLILLLIGLSILLSILNSQSSITQFALGFKYDFIPLIAFIILRRAEWSKDFLNKLPVVVIGAGALVAAYGIATFFLPMSWFTTLGYSDLHSLYLPDGPLAAFQQIGGSTLRRIQGPMSGPNQLGIWLLIPLGILLQKRVTLSASKGARAAMSWFDGLTMTIVLAAILLSFSRSAWIAAAVITLIAAWQGIAVQYRAKAFSFLASGVAVVAIVAGLFFPSILLRIASSRGHIEKPMQAIATMIDHPLGLGLGSAGPASNRVSDACVHLEAGADASWATAHPDLCVFVGDTQVQPVNEECNCPFVTENWYLQIGVELGLLGFVLYLMLVGLVLYRLYELRMENGEWRTNFSIFNFQFSIFLPFLGVCIAGLFLHSFEDAAVAYTVWVLVAVALRTKKQD